MSREQDVDVRLRALIDCAERDPTNGDLWRQVVTLASALGRSDIQATALMSLAELHHGQGQWHDEERALRALLDLVPESTQAHVLLVRCVLRGGSASSPMDDALEAAVSCVERHMDVDAARALLELALVSPSNAPSMQLEFYDVLMRLGEREEAISWFIGMMEARCHAKDQAHDDNLVAQMCELEPSTPALESRLISCLQSVGAHAEAEARRDRLLERYPDNVHAQELVALGLIEQGDIDGAALLLRRLVRTVDVTAEPSLAGRLADHLARLSSDPAPSVANAEGEPQDMDMYEDHWVEGVPVPPQIPARRESLSKPTSLPWAALSIPSTQELGAELLSGEAFVPPVMGGTEVVEAEVISARQAAPESDLDMLFALTAEAASQEAGGRAELIDLGGDDIVLLDD